MFAYHAALNILDARALFSAEHVAEERVQYEALTGHFRAHVLGATAATEVDLAYWRGLISDRGGALPLPFDGDPDGPPAPPYAARGAAGDWR